MKFNKDKTKVMQKNTAKIRDFTLNMKIDGTQIEVVDELKLLGVKLTNDLKWNGHTKYLTQKGLKKCGY